MVASWADDGSRRGNSAACTTNAFEIICSRRNKNFRRAIEGHSPHGYPLPSREGCGASLAKVPNDAMYPAVQLIAVLPSEAKLKGKTRR
jgi:hypothetical protein